MALSILITLLTIQLFTRQLQVHSFPLFQASRRLTSAPLQAEDADRRWVSRSLIVLGLRSWPLALHLTES